MARIEQREQRSGATSWRVSWRLNGRRDGAWQSVTVTSSAKEAKRVAALAKAHGHGLTRDQMIAMLDPARAVVGETVAQLCRRYVASLSVEASTRRGYERSIDLHIAPRPLGRTDLARVTREDVRRWVRAEETSGAAPKSIANHHGLLYAALSEAVDEGKLAANPCRGVRLPRLDRRRDAEDEACFLTPTEVTTIADAMPAKYRHVVWLLARTGLRWSELTALEVGDVDLLATPPTLTVRQAWKRDPDATGSKLGAPKTRMSRRTISLDAASVDMLIPRVASKGRHEFVITTDGTRPLAHTTFHRAWSRTLTRLIEDGMLEKKPRVHDLRHTHASWLLADPRVPMLFVQRRLGHESLLTTEKVYGHLRRGKDEAILAALDGLIPSQPVDAESVQQAPR